jgi:ATP-binding cassette subfamily B protein
MRDQHGALGRNSRFSLTRSAVVLLEGLDFSTVTSAALKRILSADVEHLELFIAHHPIDITPMVVVPLTALIAIFVVDWRFTLAAIVPFPIAVIPHVRYMRSEDDQSKVLPDDTKIAKLNSVGIEFVNGMSVGTIFNRDGAAVGRFAADISSHTTMVREWFKLFTGSYSLFRSLIGSPLSFILPIGVIVALFEEDMTKFIPIFVFFVIAVEIMTRPFHKLTSLVSLMNENVAGVKTIDEVLYAEELGISAEPQTPTAWSLEFDNVSFSCGEKEVLHGISLLNYPRGSGTFNKVISVWAA